MADALSRQPLGATPNLTDDDIAGGGEPLQSTMVPTKASSHGLEVAPLTEGDLDGGDKSSPSTLVPTEATIGNEYKPAVHGGNSSRDSGASSHPWYRMMFELVTNHPNRYQNYYNRAERLYRAFGNRLEKKSYRNYWYWLF